MTTSVPRTAKTRPLTIMAQDPSVTDAHGQPLLTQVNVPAEQLADGPSGYRIRVIDYDASTGTLYRSEPQRSDGAYLDLFADKQGEALVENPYFHQQNVYAIAMRILGRFEFALGRHVSWQFDTHQLKIAPHAFRERNAFYSRELEALLFGYFASDSKQSGSSGRVYTCLSHDVVAHETSHALLDGLRQQYLLPSLPDQAAFHEGFSDIVAILSVASLEDLVERVLNREFATISGTNRVQKLDSDLSRGLDTRRILVRQAESDGAKALDELQTTLGPGFAIFALAEQMADASGHGRGAGLRNSLHIKPDRNLINDSEFQPPHRRGELIVAAVLRSLVRVAQKRCHRVGVPVQGEDDSAREVSTRQLAECIAQAARDLMTICIRALDYLPPVHVTFNDFLTAILTADYELVGNDSKYEYRRVIRDSFEAYGISPAANDTGGTWSRADLSRWIRLERTDHHAMMFDHDEMFRFIWENRGPLGLSDAYYTVVTSVTPSIRVGPDGMLLPETVVEYVQSAKLYGRELARSGFVRPRSMRDSSYTILYGGGTLIFDVRGQLKYHIPRHLDDRALQSKRLEFLWDRGILRDDVDDVHMSLSNLHEDRAFSRTASSASGEVWR